MTTAEVAKYVAGKLGLKPRPGTKLLRSKATYTVVSATPVAASGFALDSAVKPDSSVSDYSPGSQPRKPA